MKSQPSCSIKSEEETTYSSTRSIKTKKKMKMMSNICKEISMTFKMPKKTPNMKSMMIKMMSRKKFRRKIINQKRVIRLKKRRMMMIGKMISSGRKEMMKIKRIGRTMRVMMTTKRLFKLCLQSSSIRQKTFQ